jgi:alkylated DNA nucleotide flippase Atl1
MRATPDDYARQVASLMERIDGLHWKWRRLVNEYGWPAVSRYLGTMVTPEEARNLLRHKREQRQERMLARCASRS